LGCSEDVARRLWAIAPLQNPRLRQSAHMGMGGTLAGNPLAVAAMKAVLGQVLTKENFAVMISLAMRLANDARTLIARRRLSWHVTQIGARVELMFAPTPPQSGAQASKMRQGGLETLLHAFYLNERILVTPFHTMFLMSPATRPDDVERHKITLERFCDLIQGAGALSCERRA
jgi:glutamate-1-semialdehyde 2,1-aminomutase